MSNDFDDLELAGLTEEELAELSEFIDPDNEMLPASDRVPVHTKKKPTGAFDRSHLKEHLKRQAEESTVGQNYVPFVKKQPAKDSQPKKSPVVVKKVTTEFDEMLDMLDADDLAELASELGIHSILDQAQSRGDEKQTASPSTGLSKPQLFSYSSISSGRFGDDSCDETDMEEALSNLEANDASLRELNLNNHTQLDSDLIYQLVDALKDNTVLQKLQMANVKFTEDHAASLGDVLRTNATLVVLNLESNRLTPKGIKALMRGISENPNTALKELRMTNQYFPGGARAESDIAKYLEKNLSLTKLGYVFKVPSFRTKVDQYIMRNTDIARKKRASITV